MYTSYKQHSTRVYVMPAQGKSSHYQQRLFSWTGGRGAFNTSPGYQSVPYLLDPSPPKTCELYNCMFRQFTSRC